MPVFLYALLPYQSNQLLTSLNRLINIYFFRVMPIEYNLCKLSITESTIYLALWLAKDKFKGRENSSQADLAIEDAGNRFISHPYKSVNCLKSCIISWLKALLDIVL